MTGATAVAGILGTLWQANRAREAEASNLDKTLHAEASKAKIAEKRRIYAQCFTTLHVLYRTKLEMGPISGRSRKSTNSDTLAAYTEALLRAITATTELGLIAPSEVANRAGVAFRQIMQENLDKDAVSRALIALPMAMRNDLGEKDIANLAAFPTGP
jgi:hypothetical protein